MGRDKALLPVDGAPLAVRAARILAAAGCAPVSLVGRQPALSSLEWPVLTEPDGPRHPLRGVAAALARATAPLVLFTPCDLPALTPDAVESLLAVGGPCRADGQPLLCVLPTSLAASALKAAEAGAPVRRFLAALPAIAVPEEALRNVNTPEQLARFSVDSS